MATVGVKGLNNWHTQHRGIATSYEKQSAVRYLNHTICRTIVIHTYTLDTGFASYQLISSNNIRLKSRNQKKKATDSFHVAIRCYEFKSLQANMMPW